MTNDRGDKIIKEQVDTLQVSFDKEAAWMRLQDRLESKDSGKGYYRTGWAAAAMLVLATVLWFSFGDGVEVKVAKEMPKVALPVANEHPEYQAKPETVVVTNRITPPEKKGIRKTVAEKKQLKPLETKQDALPMQAEIVVKEEPAPVPEPAKIVSAPKPKMKTVHINEVIEEEKTERKQRNNRYAIERHSYDELFENPYLPKNPFKITITRQN